MDGWENIGRIHTVPLSDLSEHSLCADCACGPKVVIVENTRVQHVIHNAFDGRDFNEVEEEHKNKIRQLNLKDK